MKIVYQHLVGQQLADSAPLTPNWVSSVGLEWLYGLLIKVEALCKCKVKLQP
jgi:UDP-N-acetyl-D-mannosaminuronic acid transferase (WecB/TagA/CpsF family)